MTSWYDLHLRNWNIFLEVWLLFESKFTVINTLDSSSFLTGLQSNSGLWNDVVHLSVRPSDINILVNFFESLHLSFFSVLVSQYGHDT